MKKIYLIALLFISTLTGMAQAPADDLGVPAKTLQDIEALKVAFLSQQLSLTPEEAQKFWPVYNQYSKELNSTLKDEQDIIDRDEKIVNLRKKYRDQFTNILGPQRMNKMFNAEGKFRQLLIKRLRQQRKLDNNRPNRLPRRGGLQ